MSGNLYRAFACPFGPVLGAVLDGLRAGSDAFWRVCVPVWRQDDPSRRERVAEC